MGDIVPDELLPDGEITLGGESADARSAKTECDHVSGDYDHSVVLGGVAVSFCTECRNAYRADGEVVPETADKDCPGCGWVSTPPSLPLHGGTVKQCENCREIYYEQ